MSTTSDQSLQAPRPDDTYVQSFARGLAVIRSFGDKDAPREQTMADVAKRTGITRAAARRALLTLVQLGYVQQDLRHRFSLTAEVRALGDCFKPQEA